jgi:tRNA(adenine34) deaminase
MNPTAVFNHIDLHWMRHALALARQAGDDGEVPVGAVVVKDGELAGEGRNQMIALSDPSAHAEMQALRAAAKELNNYRLPACVLYVSLEPCCMCAGAIIHSRILRLVYAASDLKTGAAGSCFDLLPNPAHNHQLEVAGGCLEAESSALLKAFFRQKRKEKASISARIP